MARVRQTARNRAVGAGKSRAKAAAVNAGAEAESETESESESWLDKVDGFGQANAIRVPWGHRTRGVGLNCLLVRVEVGSDADSTHKYTRARTGSYHVQSSQNSFAN